MIVVAAVLSALLAVTLLAVTLLAPFAVVGEQGHDAHPRLHGRLQISALLGSDGNAAGAAGDQCGGEAGGETEKPGGENHGCGSKKKDA